MKLNESPHYFLYLGLGLSLLLHLAIGYPCFIKLRPHEKKSPYPVTLVSIQIAPKAPEIQVPKPVFENPQPPPVSAPQPPPKEKLKSKPAVKPKPETKSKTPSIAKHPLADARQHKPAQRQIPPDNNSRSNQRHLEEEAKKPVFGITPESTTQTGDPAFSVRVGNTLMKGQEEAFTPPEKVVHYKVVPSFELSSMPTYKTKVEPQYPETLKAAEVEGEVLLVVTIDEHGKVLAVKVKRSDHDLFSKAAEAALKNCIFKPGMQNEMPVATIIDVPIKFVLDE
jgi:TonB family protein